MGLIAKLLSFTRTTRRGTHVTDVKSSLDGGANITAEHFASAGDDSHPLSDDYVVCVTNHGTGRFIALGYSDGAKSLAQTGEKRLYSRDGGGSAVATVWLKNDGEISLYNVNGHIDLLQNGNININGVIITPSGAMTVPVSVSAPSVVAGGKELTEHQHPYTDDGSPKTTGTNL